MLGANTVLSEFFARHPSAGGSSSIGGQYRLICQGCGTILSVAIVSPPPPALDIRCDSCGWSEHLGAPAPPVSAGLQPSAAALPLQ